MANWTVEQKAAIEIRGANLLLSAAAGSGKTAVLVERITQLILRREVEIHKLLVVTYTNAAASEMRGRIEQALSDAIEQHIGDAVYLNEQIKLLNRSSIKTFHAFCLDIIRNNFQKIDCDPGFKMLGEPERLILVRQAIEDVLETAFENKEPDFLAFVDAYSGNRSDEKLIGMILQIYGFIQSQPHPEQWLEEQIPVYADSAHPKRKFWLQLMMHYFKEKINGGLALLEYAQIRCTLPMGPEPYLPTLESDIKKLNRLLDASDDIVAFEREIMAFKFDRIASIKKDERELYDALLVEEVKTNIRDKIIKKQVIESIKSFFDYKTVDAFNEELGEMHAMIKQLSQLTCAFSQRYQQLKKKKNLMDFNDLEHFAIEILEDEQICKSYRERFEYIFVDEYQDSSGIQEHIIQSVCRTDNLFMVGDVKQSIYKFRLADPELFIGKYKSFTKFEKIQEAIHFDSSASEEVLFDKINETIKKDHSLRHIRIDLRKNFRTRGEILEKVNKVFQGIMSDDLGEITYDADAKLYPGMSFEALDKPYVEVNLLSKMPLVDETGEADDDTLFAENEEEDDEIIDSLRTEELEANAIATTIKKRLGTPVYDPKRKHFKPCSYRDFVVLLRSSRSWTPTFEQVFMETGIPLYADSNSGYFDALEVKFIVALLRIVDNPYQDVPLLTVLRSPIVGLSIDEIIWIKASVKDKQHYYKRILAAIENELIPYESRKKMADFVAMIDDLVLKSKYLPLDELVWEAIGQSNFFYYASAMPGGVSRQANLKLLVDRANELKRSRIVTLGHFIDFIDKMSIGSGDYGVANVIGEDEDVVRLMSIHKSKGLEFPIVIISGLGRKFNFMDAQGDLMLHKHLGIGLSKVNAILRTKSKTLPQFAIREQLKRETLSEEMRVLYVGLTRPVDQLILFATVKDISRKRKLWSRETDILSLITAGGYIDWIMTTLIDDKEIVINYIDQQSLAATTIEEENNERIQIQKLKGMLAMNRDLEFDDEETLNYKEVDKRLSFEPVKIINAYRPIKISVSSMKKEDDQESYSLAKMYDAPKFLLDENRITPTEIGSATHLVLEKIDINMPPDKDKINAFIEQLVERNLIDPALSDKINVLNIQRFLKSRLVNRMKTASTIFRETPFVLKVDGQLVQGIIDIYFEVENELVLVDYKTDKVNKHTIESISQRYKLQLDLYEKALIKLSGKRVREKYIYFTDMDYLYEM
ncbi:UvrD-helicase domain-containing protein [Fusibacter bizertensis]